MISVLSRRARVVAGAAGALLVPALALAGPPAAAAALPSSCSYNAATVRCTFGYTGGAQSFTVPDGVQSIAVDAFGAQGGDTYGAPYNFPSTQDGGLGGEATATLTVAPRDALEVLVGGQGGTAQLGGSAGFNGGGTGGPGGPPPARQAPPYKRSTRARGGRGFGGAGPAPP